MLFWGWVKQLSGYSVQWEFSYAAKSGVLKKHLCNNLFLEAFSSLLSSLIILDQQIFFLLEQSENAPHSVPLIYFKRRVYIWSISC